MSEVGNIMASSSFVSNRTSVESEDDCSSFGGTVDGTDDADARPATRPQLISSLRKSFRLAKSRQRGLMIQTRGEDDDDRHQSAPNTEDDPLDCDALILALDECEQELEEYKKSLKKARRKNKELLEDLADQRLFVSTLEDSYAMVKLELAEAKTNEDTLLVATQQALADRDVMILDLARERDELIVELKCANRQRNELTRKTSVLEECLAAKNNALLTVVAENESLKQELINAKQDLEYALQHRVEVLDMPQTETRLPPPPPPTTKVTNRWTKGFRNPLRRWSTHKRADEVSVATTDDSSIAPSEEDYFQ